MQEITFHSTYQVVRAALPNNSMKPGTVELINQFEAPPGFRLHSFTLLKDATALVGSAHQVVMVFERVTQMVTEVGDLPDGAMPNIGALVPEGQG